MKWLSAIVHLVTGSDPTNPSPSAGMEYFNTTSNVSKIYNGTTWLYKNEFAIPFTIGGALTVGVTGRKQRIYNRSGSPWLLIGLQAYVNTAPVGGGGASFQVNKNGSSFTNITVGSGSSSNVTTPNVSVADGDYLDIDCTAVGTTTAGSDATLTLNFAS